MNWVPIVKYIVRAVVSVSTGQVVTNVIRANTPATLKTVDKVLSVVGEFVVSAVIADQAADYVEKQINEFGKKSKPEEETKEE